MTMCFERFKIVAPLFYEIDYITKIDFVKIQQTLYLSVLLKLYVLFPEAWKNF